MVSTFDESRLDDPRVLSGYDRTLRNLAECGARLRTEWSRSADAIGHLSGEDRPRAVLALGSEARLVRAVLEPVCPVPFIAWSTEGLPGWVGPLDVVVVLASAGADPSAIAAVQEATRRGAQMIIAAPAGSEVVEFAGSRATTLIPTSTGDPLAAAMMVLAALDRMELGPAITVETIAVAADMVAEECSPYRDLSVNPAKSLACSVADAQPLIWGGSVLAARAGRRIASALRSVSGRAGLSADAEDLLAVIESTPPVDVFADPFEDAPEEDRRPCLLVVDDDAEASRIRRKQTALLAACERFGVRSETLRAVNGDQMDRYVSLLQQGRYAAAYLGIALDTPTLRG